MSTATMTSKGQITVPKEIRDDLNLVAGSKVMFVRLLSGEYRMIARTGRIQDLAGMLYDPGRPSASIEQMNDDGQAEAAADVMRSFDR